MFKLGLIINPIAGLGGAVALKGSDNQAEIALAKGAIPKATHRMQTALTPLLAYKDKITIYTASSSMGADLAIELGFNVIQCHTVALTSSAEDTKQAAQAICEHQVDLLLFAGGDGTARDILNSIDKTTVLGVPAGVKIHSGVYAITPHAAAMVVIQLLNGELVSLMNADVMDINEELFRQGKVQAKRYGEMTVPAEPRYVQAVKMGGREVDELVLADIAAQVIDDMDDSYYVMGSGSSVAAIMHEMELENTLLGVDIIKNNQLVASDVTAHQLLEITKSKPTKLVITLIGGQGHILGRGNQQLSPEFIKLIGKENIIIVATKTKLKSLAGRPLIVDNGDEQLDSLLCGYYSIITGYRDFVMYQVANPDLME